MASIKKRENGKYSVVYYYEDPKTGKTKQKWEGGFTSYKEAQIRKHEIEEQIDKDTFIPPNATTIKELMHNYIELYGKKKWGASRYAERVGMTKNYIIPICGDWKIQEITPKMVDALVTELMHTPSVRQMKNAKSVAYISANQVRLIIKLLRSAFKKAVQWGDVSKNVFELATLPEYTYGKRAAWDAKTVLQALENCKNPKLLVAIHLSFAATLRIGEICGLQWENVYISDDDIASGNARIDVKQEIERVSFEAVKSVNQKDIYQVFKPVCKANSSTRLVLKKPKTASSIRTVWLPETVARILQQWRESQERLKEVMGDEYTDLGFVLARDDGRPLDPRAVSKLFDEFRQRAGLPDVVFHSLRHSSISEKLKLNGGDIKATQGDSGHSQAKMVLDVYSHIQDQARKYGASLFEKEIYANPDLNAKVAPAQLDLASLVTAINNNPEIAAQLSALLVAANNGDKNPANAG